MGLPVHEFLRKFTIAPKRSRLRRDYLIVCEVWMDGGIKLP
jgi:hypothetical protein